MIEITDKYECCGCSACVQRCPQHCIFMKEDIEGFLYPIVNQNLCIECGLCEKVCPVINSKNECTPLKVYAAKNKNVRKQLNSSSGGVFVELAEYIISRDGVVFGAAFNEIWEVEHRFVEKAQELPILMGSKYVQSKIGETYLQCESFLKQGRDVLFVGTSCQIMGLKLFLRKEYDNLLAVDVICHGVPSPGVWRKYLFEVMEKQSAQSAANGENTVLSSSLKTMPVITGINFREKNGFEWRKYGFVVRGKSALKADKNLVLLSDIFYYNPFMNVFLANIILRPSCYKCPAKGGRCGSDMTVADYWGIESVAPEFYDDKGVSLVFVHNHKGTVALKSINLCFQESTFEDAIKNNSSYLQSVVEPKKRIEFFDAFALNKSVIDTIQKALKVSTLRRIINKVERIFFVK